MEITNNTKQGQCSWCHGNGVMAIPAQVISALRTNTRHARVFLSVFFPLSLFLTEVRGIREECKQSFLFSFRALSPPT